MVQGKTDYMTLKFAAKLDFYRHMKGWTIKEMAEICHISADRMEYLLTGKHQPLTADVLRIMKNLDIKFEPKDFEEEGVPEMRRS